MKKYMKYVRPYRSAFIIGPLMMLTEVFGEIMLPKLMSMIINNGVAQRDAGYIIKIGLVMLLTTVLMAAGGILGAYFSAKASISFTSDLRKDVFSRVQQFSFKNIDDFSTGSLVTRLTNDIQQVQNVMMMGLRLMLRAPGMLIGALFMAFWMNARLAVIILIVIPLLTAAIATILKLAFPRFEIMQKKLDRLNNGIQEVLTNVRVVKSFVREDYECKKFKEMNADLKESHCDDAGNDAGDECDDSRRGLVRRKYYYRRRHGCRRFDGIYHIYSTDSDVADDAVNGVFTEFPSHGLSKENQ